MVWHSIESPNNGREISVGNPLTVLIGSGDLRNQSAVWRVPDPRTFLFTILVSSFLKYLSIFVIFDERTIQLTLLEGTLYSSRDLPRKEYIGRLLILKIPPKLQVIKLDCFSQCE